jgi:hypothetical protein
MSVPWKKAQVTGTTETPLQPEEWYSFYTLDNTTNTTAQSDKPFTYDLPSYPPMQVKSDKPLTQPEIDQILDKLDNLKKNNTTRFLSHHLKNGHSLQRRKVITQWKEPL